MLAISKYSVDRVPFELQYKDENELQSFCKNKKVFVELSFPDDLVVTFVYFPLYDGKLINWINSDWPNRIYYEEVKSNESNNS